MQVDPRTSFKVMNRLHHQTLARVPDNVTDICVAVVGVDQSITIMSITRQAVLEQLAAASDAERRETTTTKALSSALDADTHTIEAHLNGLAACEIAQIETNGRVRVTITGEELLALEADKMVIVDSATTSSEK